MKLLDITKLAELFDLNEAHVRDRLTKRKDFPPAYRIGGALRWKAEEIENWIESRRLSPTARQSKKQVRENRPLPSQATSVPPSAQAHTATTSSPAA